MRTLIVMTLLLASPTAGIAQRVPRDQARYDDLFRKYSKRFFGVGHDWRYFKAQAMAESNLDSAALSYVGARGIMQIMPSTFAEVQSRQGEFASIDDVEWNIGAGIYYDRQLWRQWKQLAANDERRRFMFGSYNAGHGTITRARQMAESRQLNAHAWASIEQVAPDVRRWRHDETLGYVRKIQRNYAQLVARERARRAQRPLPDESAGQR
jgi:membrane-bound lytic murein transglycosylase MltF